MSVTFIGILAFRWFIFFQCLERDEDSIVCFVHDFGKFEMDTIGENNLLKIES